MLSSCVISAQYVPAKPAATASVQDHSNDPKLTFEVTEYDYGVVKKGSSMEYKFKFSNTGKSDLIFKNCNGGCECVVAKCPSSTVKPGHSGYIEVRYDSTRVGEFMKEVMIVSNASEPYMHLLLKGTVVDTDPAKNGEVIDKPVPKHAE